MFYRRDEIYKGNQTALAAPPLSQNYRLLFLKTDITKLYDHPRPPTTAIILPPLATTTHEQP